MKKLSKNEESKLHKLGSEMDAALNQLDDCAVEVLAMAGEVGASPSRFVSDLQEAASEGATGPGYVMWYVEHRRAINAIRAIVDEYNIQPSDIVNPKNP